MNKQIYYRRKEGKIIIEGKEDGKSIFIWTLPKAHELINQLTAKASFLTQEKWAKIMEKINRLDEVKEKPLNKDPKVHLPSIKRNFEKDALKPISDEDSKKLFELTK